MTHYVYIREHERPLALDPPDFWPWRNCKGSHRETALLALNKRVRERGGVADPMPFWVYVFDEDSPRHKNGRPSKVTEFRFDAHPEPNRNQGRFL